MRAEEAVAYLEAFLNGTLPDWSEGSQHGPQATMVTCMDGRLNQFLRPFRHVIRTAGAVVEPVEGSIGLAGQVTDLAFLASHGDCLAYAAAIKYLAMSFAGKVADSDFVRTLNWADTKTLLKYINTRRRLNALPDPSDQTALAKLAIDYAIQWTASNRSDKPRVGLFIDLKSALSKRAQPWVVSYDRLSGQELGHFLSAHGMNAQLVATHVLTERRIIPGLP